MGLIEPLRCPNLVLAGQQSYLIILSLLGLFGVKVDVFC
jgi:hypothetical protein